jgi:lysophospholipase L1-like esterase
MIRPLKIVWFFTLVGAILMLSSLALPKDGVELAGFNIHLPSVQSYFTKDTNTYADISDIVDQVDDIDSLPDITQIIEEKVKIDSSTIINPQDTIKANASKLAASIHKIEFGTKGKESLMKFFAKLNTTKGANIRIMHYGDSQLEGDRITSYLRNKLQKKYGGSGPGLLPALQPYGSYFSINQTNEGAWVRYPVFGKVNPAVEHNRYGPLAAFSRFAPIVPDSLFKDSIEYQASINFEESKLSYASVRNFQRVRLLYGNSKRAVEIKLVINDSLIYTDSLKAKTSFSVFEYKLKKPTKNLRIEFTGYDSPDIYGIALDALSGVSMDNIGLRGSSGTIFRKMDYNHLQQSYKVLGVDLIILQFGGNVMPYIKDTTQVVNYARWFRSQIFTLQKMNPQTAFLVIGPSDMSYKDGDKYVTYPYLPLVRDELRKAAFQASCGYWDIYEAMGGHNSMPSWVRSQPPLAGADYTHFTPRGAKLIANMFYNALMYESIK